jgi:hypothetical protein
VSRQRSTETIENSQYVTIGELVRFTGVRYSTLKFYTEEGMLPFEQAEENLTRRYKRRETMERISFIKGLKALYQNYQALPNVNNNIDTIKSPVILILGFMAFMGLNIVRNRYDL